MFKGGEKGYIMKYFSVEKKYIQGEIKRYEVASDGTKTGGSYEASGEEYGNKLVLGFLVLVYNEAGLLEDTDFYAVKSDTSKEPLCDDTGDWTYQNDEAEVLARIWKEHAPEDGWQNNNW